MADTTGKYIIQQKQADGMLTLYPQTTADQVILDSATAGMSSTNVQDAFKEVMDTIDGVTGGGVVTGVKGNAEQEYRKGQVNLTPANIGAVPANAAIEPGTTPVLVSYDANGLVTGGRAIQSTDLPNLDGTYVNVSQKGTANGVASLDETGHVPSTQLPSYVDDVKDTYVVGSTPFAADWLSLTSGGEPLTPETDKIYLVVSEGTYQNREYRWSGTQYAEVSPSLALGETATTAYPGDQGKANADAIAAIEDGTTTVPNAASAQTATTATNAGNVTATINGQAITDIFERNGTTAKEATHAASADSATSAASAGKLTASVNIGLSGDATGSIAFDGSAAVNIPVTLANSGVSAGTYSAVTVNAKGLVTAGAQTIAVDDGSGTVPQTLATGGIFFKQVVAA